MPQFFRVVEHIVPCSHSREYLAATRHGDADRLKLAVKQYIPLNNPNPQPGDVTIIGAHANGFPKVTTHQPSQPFDRAMLDSPDSSLANRSTGTV